MNYEPTTAQTDQILDVLQTCHVRQSARAFLRTWIRDWTHHKTHDDTALLRQALEALENSAVKHPQQIEGKNAAIAALRKRLNLCPACGADTRQNHDYVSNIETFWTSCTECDWKGEPE